jgi:hypothetical protein
MKKQPWAQSRACKVFTSPTSFLLFIIFLIAFTTTAHAGKFTCSIDDPGTVVTNTPVSFSANVNGAKPPYMVTWTFPSATPDQETQQDVPAGNISTGDITFNEAGQVTVILDVSDSSKGKSPKTCRATRMIDVQQLATAPTARGDTYSTPVGKTLTVEAATVSGVLYNDFIVDADTGEQLFGPDAGLTAVLVDPPAHGTLDGGLNDDGSFTYVPGGSQGDNDNDSFTYRAVDAYGAESEVATVNIHTLSDQPDFKIMMNYELGMHCTGFEFSYCCVLPPYNSIVAQVVKPQMSELLEPDSNADYPRLLEGDPNNGLDGLGRQTVLRDYDGDGNIKKYFLEYYHDAMPRREGNMPGTFNSTEGKNTLISDIEGNSMLYWNAPYDSAMVDTDGSMTGVPGKLVTGTYGTVPNVVVGDGSYKTPCVTPGLEPGCTDNYANGWLNHFFIYVNDEGHPNLEGHNATGTTLEADKIRLGVAGMVEYPKNVGAALQPMGPDGNVSPFDNVLTFSGDTGTVVYTQSKVLENLPIQLTSPRLWEALGLPLTPFEDQIGFFADPASVAEDSVRPFVAMKARLVEATCFEDGTCSKGDPVIGSNGEPVIGFGTAPIDIPNCERCHSAPAIDPVTSEPNVNSPNYVRRQDGPSAFYGPSGETLEEMTNLEIEYWKFVYPTLATSGNDWYARLKGAAINMIAMHDYDVGTDFSANYPTSGVTDGVPDPLNDILDLPTERAAIPQNTRMGHESVICQKCHADNVIAVVKSAGTANWQIPPISEAVHNAHRAESADGPIAFDDSFGRFGGCQGCHPAHRSDGSMDKYPITQNGDNANAAGDNRTGKGGCFVGRDVHSNPLKDVDGAETPSHLNAVGEWLVENVAEDSGEWRGIWCTNCHTQLSQEIWRKEDCNDLINGDCLVNPRGAADLDALASMLGMDPQKVVDYLDPKNPNIDPGRTANETHAAWKPYDPSDPHTQDANVATIEVGPGGPVGTTDGDGDFSVNILSFCTTDDCVDRINDNKSDESAWRYPEGGAVDGQAGFMNTDNNAVAVPFSAATDGRDHWLAAGEPHCADCHAAPFVEQSGNINPFPPFNYPAKAALMRYSRGHQDLSCQSCHESIHGLYPVGPAIDNTSHAQAAALNHDGSHGPLKCGACHAVDGEGIPDWIALGGAVGQQATTYDEAVSWAHTYTAEANVLNTTCQNCHGVDGDFFSPPDTNSSPADWTKVASHEWEFLAHADIGFTSRQMMDKAELLVNGRVTGTIEQKKDKNERKELCSVCHEGKKNQQNKLGQVACNDEWREHLSRGRVAESVWEEVSLEETGTRCGW